MGERLTHCRLAVHVRNENRLLAIARNITTHNTCTNISSLLLHDIPVCQKMTYFHLFKSLLAYVPDCERGRRAELA